MNLSQLVLDARALAVADGLDRSQTDRYIYAFWGMLEVGFSSIAVSASSGFNVGTLAHEFGHTLNHTGHAGSLENAVSSTSLIGPNLFDVFEGGFVPHRYADQFDAMGGGQSRLFSAYHRQKMGMLLPGETVSVSPDGGEFLLDQLEFPSDGIKQIRVPLGSDHLYTLEYRRPIGIFDGPSSDPWDPDVPDGVLIRLHASHNQDQDTLIIEGPSGHPVVLNPATSFTDLYRGVSVDVLEKTGNNGGQARVLVSLFPVPDSIAISPVAAELAPRESFTFTAQGFDASGSPIASEFVWSTSGGTVDVEGLYTAPAAPGMYAVTASGGSTSASAMVNVVLPVPVLTFIDIQPRGVTLTPGATQQFTAAGLDQFGAPFPAEITWFVLGGFIDSTGFYTAPPFGEFNAKVSAYSRGISASVPVYVHRFGAVLSWIEVLPASSALAPGETVQFTAQGYDQFDLPMEVSITWSTDGGVVGADGLYTAPGVTGTYAVTAASGAVSGSASVTVRPCVGNCNADRVVTIDELLRCVNISLSNQPRDYCPVCDANGDGKVAVNELIQAVNAALNGCP